MIYLGIDPGLTGAMVALNRHGEVVFAKHFEPNVEKQFDAHLFSDWITELRCIDAATNRILAAVEKVHAFPGQGVSSTFKFGCTYGKILGVLAAKLIPYELISPVEWCGVMLAGEDKEQGKNRARLVAQRLFPEVNLKVKKRAIMPHSGLADAILIAEYLRRKNGTAA